MKITVFSAVVKNVLSGDTVVLYNPQKHVEKIVTLAQLQTPRTERKEKQQEEEVHTNFFLFTL